MCMSLSSISMLHISENIGTRKTKMTTPIVRIVQFPDKLDLQGTSSHLPSFLSNCYFTDFSSSMAMKFLYFPLFPTIVYLACEGCSIVCLLQ